MRVEICDHCGKRVDAGLVELRVSIQDQGMVLNCDVGRSLGQVCAPCRDRFRRHVSEAVVAEAVRWAAAAVPVSVQIVDASRPSRG